ncbi:hypothetical protein CspHIS471_0100230 [Cutaneotrichosporon sp. HIS471]|nr:hypothetical protein CspHIS471_0100230 [Cutaneotrichosporon sp. HIS471]
MSTQESQEYPLYAFWGLVESAWSQVKDDGLRVKILATLLSSDDLYDTKLNETPDLNRLHSLVADINKFLPYVSQALIDMVNRFSHPQRKLFFWELLHAIGALNVWDGLLDLPLTSAKNKPVRARCWVVIMGREMYYVLRSNASTHAYLDYVQSACIYDFARELHFKISHAKEADKSRVADMRPTPEEARPGNCRLGYAHNLPQTNSINVGILNPLGDELSNLNLPIDSDTNSHTSSDTCSDTDSPATSLGTLNDSDNFWGHSSGQAITLATAIMDATESKRPRICSRDGFWDSILSAWAIVGCHGHASLITSIRNNTLNTDEIPHMLNNINDNMPLMLHVLESRLDHYPADALRAWNEVSHGMFHRMQIGPVREVLAANDTEWRLARAWAIAAGFDIYIALMASPETFTALRGVHCQKIIQLAPEMYERKFGTGTKELTR